MKLSRKERQYLISRHRQEKKKKICDRIKAVLLCDDGYSYAEIARILLLDDETIRRHIHDYCKKNKKIELESGGSTSKLSEQETEALKKHLDEKTYAHVKDICQYVKKTFKKKYTVSGMTKWLHHNGFCYKKPQGVPAKLDKDKQRSFIQKYKKLKKKTTNKEPIYFVDSVHPEHQTRLSYGWIRKGAQKNIGMTGRQYRLNYMGGICLDRHEVVYEQAEKVNEDSMQSFLFKLRKKHPGKYHIHVIWDNAGYHRSKQVNLFAKELGIKLHYLPPYSPNLNPIERLWKIMHEHVTYNKYYKSFSDFTEAIKHFFQHIGKKKNLLRARITDNFQLIDPPDLAF